MLMEKNPATRITAKAALSHDWIKRTRYTDSYKTVTEIYRMLHTAACAQLCIATLIATLEY
jgi:serine/threonine protein kinase